MLNCPVCLNMGADVNTKLTELDVQFSVGGSRCERTMECDAGHEFIVVYAFVMFEYVAPTEGR